MTDLRAIVEKGRHAGNLRDSAMFREVIDGLRVTYRDAFEAADPSDADSLQNVAYALKILAQIETAIDGLVTDGIVAKSELDEAEQADS